MKKCKNTECNNDIEEKRQYCSLKCRNVYVNKNLRDYSKNGEALSQKKFYNGNEKKCKKCENLISYENRWNTYCSHSCATSISNQKRKINKSKTKVRIQKIRNFYKENLKEIPCKYCNKKISIKQRKLYCSDDCKTKHRRKNMSGFQSYKQDCLFKFSLNNFPNEFDFELIKKHGWYSPANKKNNLNGVSRDHMFSVKEGFLNKINPELISHPANCKLVLQKENSSKHKNSSISIDDLKKRIIDWDYNYRAVTGNGIGVPS